MVSKIDLRRVINLIASSGLILFFFSSCGGGGGTSESETPLVEESYNTIINTVENRSMGTDLVCRPGDEIRIVLLADLPSNGEVKVSFEAEGHSVLGSPTNIGEATVTAVCPTFSDTASLDVAVRYGHQRTPYQTMRYMGSDVPFINSATFDSDQSLIQIEGGNLDGDYQIHFPGQVIGVINQTGDADRLTVNSMDTIETGYFFIRSTNGDSNSHWVEMYRNLDITIESPIASITPEQIDVGLLDDVGPASDGSVSLPVRRDQPALLHGVVEVVSTGAGSDFYPVLYLIALPDHDALSMTTTSTAVAFVWKALAVEHWLDTDDWSWFYDQLAGLSEIVILANYIDSQLDNDMSFLLEAHEDTQYVALFTDALIAASAEIALLRNRPNEQQSFASRARPFDLGYMGLYGPLARVDPESAGQIRAYESGSEGDITLSNDSLLFASVKVTSADGVVLRDHPLGYFSGYINPASYGILSLANNVSLGVPKGEDAIIEVITAGSASAFEPRESAKLRYPGLVTYLRARTIIEQIVWPFFDSVWGLGAINADDLTKIMWNHSKTVVVLLGEYAETGKTSSLEEAFSMLLVDFANGQALSTALIKQAYGVASGDFVTGIAYGISEKMADKLGAVMKPVVGQIELAWEVAGHLSNLYSVAGTFVHLETQDSIINFNVTFPLKLTGVSPNLVVAEGSPEELEVTGIGFGEITDYDSPSFMGDDIVYDEILSPEFYLTYSNGFRSQAMPASSMSPDGTSATFTIDPAFLLNELEGSVDISVRFPGHREVFLSDQLTIQKAASSGCGDYEAQIDGVCVNFLIPELITQAQIDAIETEAETVQSICPSTKQQEGSRFVDIPEDTSSGTYTRCEYVTNDLGSQLGYQTPYVNGEFAGVRFSYTETGELFTLQRSDPVTRERITLWYQSDGFMNQLYFTNYYSESAVPIDLTMYFQPDGQWLYNFGQGVTGQYSGQWVQFSNTSVNYVELYNENRIRYKVMRFENTIMTECQMTDGNTVLSDCMP